MTAAHVGRGRRCADGEAACAQRLRRMQGVRGMSARVSDARNPAVARGVTEIPAPDAGAKRSAGSYGPNVLRSAFVVTRSCDAGSAKSQWFAIGRPARPGMFGSRKVVVAAHEGAYLTKQAGREVHGAGLCGRASTRRVAPKPANECWPWLRRDRSVWFQPAGRMRVTLLRAGACHAPRAACDGAQSRSGGKAGPQRRARRQRPKLTRIASLVTRSRLPGSSTSHWCVMASPANCGR